MVWAQRGGKTACLVRTGVTAPKSTMLIKNLRPYLHRGLKVSETTMMSSQSSTIKKEWHVEICYDLCEVLTDKNIYPLNTDAQVFMYRQSIALNQQ